MTPGLRAANLALVAAAGGLAGAVWWLSDAAAWRVVRTLQVHDEPVYAAWATYVALAPALNLLAWWATRRTPWPHVVAVTTFLLSTVAAGARIDHWLPWWWPLAVAALAAVGVLVIVRTLEAVGPTDRS
ncbi:hypothetical protein ACFQ0K_05290 [Nocardioides caeni]|uniref:Uncharacterized protein n=1 Tax=Nocardioides caeni TaxID=574700 RepID=A0A4S8NAK7_9ACTN|nr:hypothetical protein [Nocardioides caeni]THV12109.1 hypothetical protein E9934_12205 [Nocardioides caeni]